MKAAHTVLYMKKYTQMYNSYPASHITDQLHERGVDLEVEGVRYIEMHRGPGQIFGGAYFRLFQAPLLRMRSTCALRRSRPVLVYRVRREII